MYAEVGQEGDVELGAVKSEPGSQSDPVDATEPAGPTGTNPAAIEFPPPPSPLRDGSGMERNLSKKFSSARAPSKIARDLSWKNVNFKVGDKEILRGCWGHVPAGKVCAILGPSGSGKTSLLNILAGRTASSGKLSVSAQVRVGSQEINPVMFRKNIAYVMQDDALMQTATPREALRFSATLRMPASAAIHAPASVTGSKAQPSANLSRAEQVNILVERTLEELGLLECADVMIGGPLIKGISGGQRKRTSVGVEIINDPALLFLDEPTSGLDSYNAFHLVALLKVLAGTNSSVLCTIHQPSSEVFFLFDMVICMQAGRVLYHGTASDMPTYLAARGRVCPEYYNPSDYIMNLCLQLEGDELDAIAVAKPDHLFDDDHKGRTSKQAGDESGEELSNSAIQVESSSKLEQTELVFFAETGFFTQLYYLVGREALNVRRDIGALIGRYGVTCFLAIIFGLIFKGAGGRDNADTEDFNTHVGALAMLMISSMFLSASPTMLNFPFERPIFIREYSTGTYGTTPYFISKLCSEAPLTFVQMLIMFLICYFLMELQGNFIILVLGAYGTGMVSNSLAVLLGCAVGNAKQATELQPLVFVPQILFAGFFIRSSQVPVFLRWAQYLCGLKYGMYIQLLAEFDLRLDSCSDDDPMARENCRQIKSSNDVEADQWYLPMIMLFVLFLGFRSLAAYLLAQKARHFY